MQSNALLEILEPRRLFSADALDGSSVIPDADGRPIFTTPAGKVYVLPYVNSKGSLSVTGSDNADQVAITQVTGIAPSDADGDQANGVLQELLQKPPSPVSADERYTIAVGNMKLENWQGLLERSKASLADAQASLQNLQNSASKTVDSQGDAAGSAFSSASSASQIANATERVKQQQQQVDTLANEVDLIQSGSLTRVQLAGVYDVYIESSILTNVIRVDGGAGNDDVSVGTNVAQKSSIIGGTGADKLTTGSKRSIVYGGGGADRLFSRSKHGGTLDGGTGADRYFNRVGEVQILARKDGDQVIVNNTCVAVTESGVFGTVAMTTSCYYMIDTAAGKVDLLASN